MRVMTDLQTFLSTRSFSHQIDYPVAGKPVSLSAIYTFRPGDSCVDVGSLHTNDGMQLQASLRIYHMAHTCGCRRFVSLVQ